MANYLFAHRNNPYEGSLVIKFLLFGICDGTTLSELASCIDRPISSAVESLNAGSLNLAALQARVPHHAIVGVAPDFSIVEDFLNVVIMHFDGKLDLVGHSDTVDSIMSGGAASDVSHDTIVPTSSQGDGACTSRSVTGIVHTAETDSSDVFREIAAILGDSEECGARQAFAESNRGQAFGRGLMSTPPAGTIDFSSMVEVMDSELQITPASGSELSPALQATITVSSSSRTITRCIFGTNDSWNDVTVTPFSATVPKESFAPITIRIVALFSDNTFVRTSATYTTSSPGEAIFLDIRPRHLNFAGIGESFQLIPMARYENGSADVREQATYTLDSNAKTAVTVSPAGVVEAVGHGTATVHVLFEGLNEDVEVTVGQVQPITPTMPASYLWSNAVLLGLALIAAVLRRRRSSLNSS